MELHKKTVVQLRQYCKDNKIRGYSKYRKAELINFIKKEMKKRDIDDLIGDLAKMNIKEVKKKKSRRKKSRRKNIKRKKSKRKNIKIVEEDDEIVVLKPNKQKSRKKVKEKNINLFLYQQFAVLLVLLTNLF